MTNSATATIGLTKANEIFAVTFSLLPSPIRLLTSARLVTVDN